MTVKDSPLAEIHRANGARFVDRDGWRVPAGYGSVLTEYQAVRSRAGLLDLCRRSPVRFTGADRVEYLNGMVSNDVKTLNPGTGTYAAIVNVQGKILADVRLFRAEESLLLDLPEFLKDIILDHLNRHLVADEVEIEDLTERYGMISIQGPVAAALLRAVFPQDLPANPLSHSLFDLAGHEIRIVRATHTGEEGYDLIAQAGQLQTVASLIEKAFEPLACVWVGVEAEEILRVEAGIPRYGIDMDADNLLLETGLESHLSFHKGCYLGQEVVERIRSRGHVNKKLSGIVLEGTAPAERGDRIYAGEKEIGEITSSVISPHLNAPIALAYVHRDFLDAGTPVVCREKEKSVQGKIVELPFYRIPSGM
ncbi:MAG: aminomethyltransferase family protein [Candidatus Binatia bacterium]